MEGAPCHPTHPHPFPSPGGGPRTRLLEARLVERRPPGRGEEDQRRHNSGSRPRKECGEEARLAGRSRRPFPPAWGSSPGPHRAPCTPPTSPASLLSSLRSDRTGGQGLGGRELPRRGVGWRLVHTASRRLAAGRRERAGRSPFNGLIIQMGKARPHTADSFVRWKPPPWGGLGCHPGSRATARRPGLSPRSKLPSAAARTGAAGGGAAGALAGAQPGRWPGRWPRGPAEALRPSLSTAEVEGGRAPRRTSEPRRGGARAARSLTGAGEEAGGAEQRAAQRGQQAGARHRRTSWGVGGPGAERKVGLAVLDGGISLQLRDRNKSGSAAPPPGPRAPPRPAGGGLGAGLRSGEGWGAGRAGGNPGVLAAHLLPRHARPTSGLRLV